MEIEDDRIEYKSELTNKLKREIVSFLNTDGGIIYLGVDDLGNNLKISSEQKHEWEEKLNHWYTNAFYPTPFSLIEIKPNNRPFMVKVKAGRNKPYCIEQNGFDSRGVYIRVGSSAVRATNEQISRMIQQNIKNGEFDSEISPIQKLTFKSLKNRAESKDVNFNINALRVIKEPGLYNNAGLLFSDQNPNIVKAAIYDGKDVMSFKDKREFDGAITTQINDLLFYINLNNSKKAIITGDAQRKEIRAYPTTAIREAIVNAFAHRDYLLHSEVKVEIFDDRIEILSPGGIPDGLTLEEIQAGMTAVRNPQLVHVLDKMKYIENYGTGIRRMYDSYKDTGFEPIFKVMTNSFKVILPNINYNIDQNRVVSTNENSALKSIKSKILTQDSIINYMQDDKGYTRRELQNYFAVTSYRMIKMLNNLVSKNIIVKKGKSVNTKYFKK